MPTVLFLFSGEHIVLELINAVKKFEVIWNWSVLVHYLFQKREKRSVQIGGQAPVRFDNQYPISERLVQAPNCPFDFHRSRKGICNLSL